MDIFKARDRLISDSPESALLGETKTHNEALAMLAPDAEVKPKKTSVYLDGPRLRLSVRADNR